MIFRFRNHYKRYKTFFFRLNIRLDRKTKLLANLTLFLELFCFSIILVSSVFVGLCFYYPFVPIFNTHIFFWCYSISFLLFQEFLAVIAFIKLYVLIRLINARSADVVVLQLFLLINLLFILYLFVVFVPCFNLLYGFYIYVPPEDSVYAYQMYTILASLDLKYKK